MKIGSGGLQSLISQEVAPVKKIENVQNKKEEGSILDPGIAKPVVKEDELIQAVEQVNKSMDLINRSLKFQIHEETERLMVKVYDQDTGEVIKEIPPEEFLNMVAKLRESFGIFIDQYV